MASDGSRRRYGAVVAMLCAVSMQHTPVQAANASLADLSFEELGSIQITSVSKRPERLSDAPASVFVITAEDIRRAGATSLPEALRLAPNLQVAQYSAGQYAISSRGFNNRAGNKLLVMIDGRSVYTPLFSGVFWDAQDVMLEDIERIEVISGPGGTLWGANAVNGVINIITQSARDTPGTVLSAGGAWRGTDVSVRYGGSYQRPFGDETAFRAYAKYFDQAHTAIGDGSPVDDDWHKKQAGFRLDGGPLGDQWTVQGDAYEGREGQAPPGIVPGPEPDHPLNFITLSGANLSTRWRHRLADGSGLDLLAYYDRTVRDVPATFSETLDTVDLQLQHSWALGRNGSFTWGGEYRHVMDRILNGSLIAFLPADVDQVSASLFAQGQVGLLDDWQLTLGARMETNPYTGLEFLPNVRLAWKVAPEHLLWAAASRTVRAPSRTDRDFYYPEQGPFVLGGGPDFRSETARVYELGYRGQPVTALSYSITLFYADYDDLRTFQLGTSSAPLILSNETRGTTSGVETWGTYQASTLWRISAGLSTLAKRLAANPGVLVTVDSLPQNGNDPRYSWNLRSVLNLSHNCELDVMVRRVGSLPEPQVPSYWALDLRVGWRPRPDIELSIGGQNLFNHRHAEFDPVSTRSAFGPRAFFKVASRF